MYNYNDAIEFVTWIIERLHNYEYMNRIRISSDSFRSYVYFRTDEDFEVEVWTCNNEGKYELTIRDFRSELTHEEYVKLVNLTLEAQTIKEDAVRELLTNKYKIFSK